MKQKRTGRGSTAQKISPATILVVEDNPITLKLVQVTLQKEGYLAVTAPDGKTALEYAARQMPDLILQDLKLPDIDGIELVRKLRALPGGDGIPIVAFTGFVTRVEEGIVANVGFTDFLIKPVEPSQLIAAIRTYLLPSQVLAERPGLGRHLLLVDDDPILLKYSRLQFTNAGFDVTTAHNGQDALDQARKQPPDIIVCDVLMPGMDGFQMCYAVRQDPVLRKVPVVLMSANYVEEADRKLAERIGAAAYMYRSLGIKEILNAVVDSLSRKVSVPAIRTEEEFERERHARIVWQLDRMVNLRVGAVQRSYTQAAILNELSLISETLIERRDIESALEGILAHCLDGAGLSKGLLYLTDDQGRLKLHAQYGCGKMISAARDLFSLPDLFSQCLGAEYPVQVPSPALPAKATRALLTQTESESALIIPIPKTDGSRGLLALFSTSRNLVEEDWVAFGRSLATQIAQTVALSQAILKLANSEQRYRIVTQATNDVVWDWNLDTNTLWWNENFQSVFGYRAEAIEPGLQSWTGRLHPDDMERVVSGIHNVIESGTKLWSDEYRFLRADGRYAFIYDRGFVIHDAKGNPDRMIGAMTDITQRKQAEVALQESESRYRLLVQNSPYCIHEIDRQGRLISMNRAGLEMMRVQDEGAIRGRRYLEMVADREQERISRLLDLALQGQSSEFEFVTANKLVFQSSFVPIKDEKGEVQRLMGLARDVTERKQAEDTLRESEERARLENQILDLLLRHPGDEMYAEVLSILLKQFESRFGFFGYIRETDGALVCPSMTRDIWEVCAVEGKSVEFPRASWGGLWGRILTEHQPLLKNELHKTPKGHVPLFRSMGAPLLVDGELIGSIHLANRASDYTTGDLELLAHLCAIIAPTLKLRLHRDKFESERKQAQEQVQRLAHLLEESLNEIYVFDSETLKFQTVNRGARENLGYSMEELRALTPLDLKPEYTPESFAALIQPLRTGAQHLIQFNTYHRRKDGSTYPAEVHLQLFSNTTPQTFVAIILDITERMQAEAVRFKSQQNMLQAQTIAHFGNWTWNLQHDYLTGSEELFRIIGMEYTQETIPLSTFVDRIHPDDQDTVSRILDTIIANISNELDFEFRIKLPNGDIRAAHAQGAGYYNEQHELTHIFGVIQDITESKRAVEALRESEHRFRQLADNINEAFFLTNPESTQILYASPAYETIFGIKLDSLVANPQSWIQGLAAEEQAKGFASVESAKTTGNFDNVYSFKHPDGRQRWVRTRGFPIRDEYGVIYRIAGIAEDITGRKLAEQKALGQIEHLSLLDQITRAIGERQDLHSIFQIVLTRLETGLHLDFGCIGVYDQLNSVTLLRSAGTCNPAGLDLQAQPRLNIHTNGFNICLQGQVVYEPDISRIPLPFPQSLAACGLRSVVMVPLRVKDNAYGILITARRKEHSFSSSECEFLRQLCDHIALAMQQSQLYDALQAAYDDLRQSQQAVMQQERLRAIGQMASGMAHDINNALSPVALFTESILETELNLSAKTREHLEIIQRAVDDVAQTIERMRDFYRQGESQVTLKPVQVNHLVEEVLSLCRARFEMPQQHGIVIEARTELAPSLPDIMGIESEIREALVNLVFNAVDALPKGGTITLRTHTTPGSDASVPATVVIEVTDTGLGMEDDTRQRCFEPFFTTKGEGGTGLGLAMVYGMIQRHTGEIEIDSAPGAGTCMRLMFPMSTTTPEESAQLHTHPVPTGLRLLVVDDDLVLLQSMQHILHTDGHVTVTASDGQQGIDSFLGAIQQGTPFDAVITDLGMPHIDGRRVAAAVKHAAPSTPVILLTGWGQQILADNETPPYVDHVLSKPPKLQQLRNTLAICCGSVPTKPTA